MSYFILDILLLLPLLAAHFPISTAKELYEIDKMFIGFVQHPNSFEQFCENEGYGARGEDENYDYIKERMEQPLGIVYLLRLKWKCAKIGEKFTDDVEKNGCIMYRKYLDILYEYLYRMYAGMPAVKPKFYLDKTFAYSTLRETVESLAIIWNFYFISTFAERYSHKLERLFIRFYEPKLFNEDALNYGPNLDNQKETFQGSIVQMGLEIKWDNGIKESYVKLIRLNFDKFLKEMLINWRKKYRYSNFLAPSAFGGVMFNEHQRLLLNFFSTNSLINDATFIAFLRGQSHFDEIFTELKKNRKAYSRGFIMKKEDSAQKHQSDLSLLYLMKLNWNCTKIVKQRTEEEKVLLECEKFGNYLNILYEYLFQIYAKTEVAQLAELSPPVVRPLFQNYETVSFGNLSLSDAIDKLHEISLIFFTVEEYGDHISDLFTKTHYNLYALDLPNTNKLVDYQADFGKRNETMRQAFDAKLKTILKEARKEEKTYETDIGVSASPFYDYVRWDEDRTFIAFLKDESKLKQYCEDREDDMLPMFNDKLTENATVEQKTEFFTQKFEAHLGVVYLMRENWHCAQVSGEFKPEEQTKCQEYRKCLDILSKYLFSVGAEDEDPVKAINSQFIIRKFQRFGTLTDVVRVLNRLSSFFFDPKFRQNHQLENVLENLKISRLNPGISIPKFERIFESVTENEAIEAQMFKDETFDKKMEEMFNRAEENERKEAEKLKSKKRKAEKEDQMEEEEMKSAAFDDKFGTLLASPFYPRPPTIDPDH